MVDALSKKENLSFFSVAAAFVLPNFIPISISTLIKLVLLVWIAVLEFKKFRLIGSGIIRNKKNAKEYILGLTLILSCCFDGIINLIQGGELRWNSFLMTIVIFVLFIDYCSDYGYKEQIIVFINTCNLFVVVSFIEVVIKVVFFNDNTYMLSLCGYDNGLGAYLPPLACLNLFFIKDNKKCSLSLLSVILSVVQVIMVYSVVSIFCMFFVLVIFVFNRTRVLKHKASPIVLFFLSIITFVYFILLRWYDNKAVAYIVEELLHRDMNFSGRVQVWYSAIIHIKDSLLFGHGADTLTQIALWKVPNTHNFYLDILNRSGLIGIFFFLAYLVMSYCIISENKSEEGYALFSYFLVLLIPMQFESYCNYAGYPLYFFLLVLAVYIKHMSDNYDKRTEVLNDYLPLKRIFDLVIAIPGLVITVVVAFLIKVVQLCFGGDDKGPLFYKQLRVGLNGKEFLMIKFRTMVVGADEKLKEIVKDEASCLEWEKNYKLENDPRVTRLGKILRKYSIDELPQFWNVLMGDMSCIGPRPLVPQELESFGGNPKLYYSIKPGITSWWACNGRNNMEYDKRLELEYYYINNISLKLDILTFFKTIKTVFVSRNGY